MNLMKLFLVEGQTVTEKVTKGVSQLLIKLVKTKPNNATPPPLPPSKQAFWLPPNWSAVLKFKVDFTS